MKPMTLVVLCALPVMAESWSWPPPSRPAPGPAAPTAGSTGSAPAPGRTAPLANLKPGLYAIFQTSLGSITAKLFEQEAPDTVNAFAALANGSQSWRNPRTGAMVSKPLYQNLTFDRVIPNSVIQTGDPTGSGRYDCGVRTRDEFVPSLRFDRPGRLGVLNLGEPDTGGCQFFITDAAYPALNPSARRHGYVVFGQVVDGQEVVNKISNVQSDKKDRPVEPVTLVGITIQRVGPGPAGTTKPVKRKVPLID